MKLNLQHHNVRSTHELDSLIENCILALQPRLQIDEANVRLECRFESSPAFGVRIHLVTPGPDVVAEGRDHTIRAAIRKAMAEIESRLNHRSAKRRQNARSNPLVRSGRARASHTRRHHHFNSKKHHENQTCY
jgi:ribosome-associated translation inhibitor RaiA